MEFTWGHLFLLAEKMFIWGDKDVANRLDVARTTIYRHKKGIVYSFEPPKDVYLALFAPSDKAPDTLEYCYQKLVRSLNDEAFPTDFRTPMSPNYRESIEYLIEEANEASRLARMKRPMQVESSDDDTEDTLLQEKADEEQNFSMTDLNIDTSESSEDFEEGEYPEIELEEPEYYGEYCHNRLKKSFGMYDGWDSEPLEPDLKEKWGSVCIADEFFRCVKDYGIEDFLAIAPSELLPMRNVVSRNDVVDRIRNAARFVDHMIPAKDHMMITRENKEIFTDISNFTHLLRIYLNFLRENSNNSDLFGDVFIFALSGDRELEAKANKYYDELISRFKDLQGRLERQNECRPN